MKALLRSRTYTLNGWMNSSQTNAGRGWNPTHFLSMPQKLSQIVRPPPSVAMVFIDESEESIDDGLWNSPPHGELMPDGLAWDNLPTDRHDRGANLGFADGHTTFHPWLWSKRNGNPGQLPRPWANAKDLKDMLWLLQLSPVEGQ